MTSTEAGVANGHAKMMVAGLTALLLLGAAPAARADAPLAGETYEGSVKKGVRDATLVVSGNGRKVTRLHGSFHRGCRVPGRSNVGQLGLLAAENLRIRDGRFSYRRDIRYPETGGRLTTRLSGRFVDGGTGFVGKLRELMVNPEMGSRCDSRTIRLRGRVPLRTQLNGSWSGATDQGSPLALTVDRRGLHGLSFDVTLTCTNGEQVVQRFPTPDRPVEVDDRGEFYATHSPQYSTTVSVRGRLRPKGLTGTITAMDSIEREVTDDRGRTDQRTFSCSAEVPLSATRG